MSYDASSKGFIERIRGHLLSQREDQLLYAALELRCAVEARMQAYLEPLDHIPRTHKEEYSLPKLGKTTERTFQLGDRTAVFTFYFDDGTPELTLRYIPVSKRLQTIASRLGNALHFPGEEKLENPDWWHSLRTELIEGLAWLRLAASGDLLGAPMMNSKTKRGSLYAVMENADPRWTAFRRLAALPTVRVEVAYKPMPPLDIASALSAA